MFFPSPFRFCTGAGRARSSLLGLAAAVVGLALHPGCATVVKRGDYDSNETVLRSEPVSYQPEGAPHCLLTGLESRPEERTLVYSVTLSQDYVRTHRDTVRSTHKEEWVVTDWQSDLGWGVSMVGVGGIFMAAIPLADTPKGRNQLFSMGISQISLGLIPLSYLMAQGFRAIDPTISKTEATTRYERERVLMTERAREIEFTWTYGVRAAGTSADSTRWEIRLPSPESLAPDSLSDSPVFSRVPHIRARIPSREEPLACTWMGTEFNQPFVREWEEEVNRRIVALHEAEQERLRKEEEERRIRALEAWKTNHARDFERMKELAPRILSERTALEKETSELEARPFRKGDDPLRSKLIARHDGLLGLYDEYIPYLKTAQSEGVLQIPEVPTDLASLIDAARLRSEDESRKRRLAVALEFGETSALAQFIHATHERLRPLYDDLVGQPYREQDAARRAGLIGEYARLMTSYEAYLGLLDRTPDQPLPPETGLPEEIRSRPKAEKLEREDRKRLEHLQALDGIPGMGKEVGELQLLAQSLQSQYDLLAAPPYRESDAPRRSSLKASAGLYRKRLERHGERVKLMEENHLTRELNDLPALNSPSRVEAEIKRVDRMSETLDGIESLPALRARAVKLNENLQTFDSEMARAGEPSRLGKPAARALVIRFTPLAADLEAYVAEMDRLESLGLKGIDGLSPPLATGAASRSTLVRVNERLDALRAVVIGDLTGKIERLKTYREYFELYENISQEDFDFLPDDHRYFMNTLAYLAVANYIIVEAVGADLLGRHVGLMRAGLECLDDLGRGNTYALERCNRIVNELGYVQNQVLERLEPRKKEALASTMLAALSSSMIRKASLLSRIEDPFLTVNQLPAAVMIRIWYMEYRKELPELKKEIPDWEKKLKLKERLPFKPKQSALVAPDALLAESPEIRRNIRQVEAPSLLFPLPREVAGRP